MSITNRALDVVVWSVGFLADVRTKWEEVRAERLGLEKCPGSYNRVEEGSVSDETATLEWRRTPVYRTCPECSDRFGVGVVTSRLTIHGTPGPIRYSMTIQPHYREKSQ